MTLEKALATGKDAVQVQGDQAARVFVNAMHQYEVLVTPAPKQEALYNWSCATLDEVQAIIRQHTPSLKADGWGN